MPEWTPRSTGRSLLTPNEIGRQAYPLMQPSITSPYGDGMGRARFITGNDPRRPFSEVGKMSINLGSPAAGGEKSGAQVSGFVQGAGAGIGRWLGGFVGQAQAGADIGEAIGRVGQAPLDLVANALGNIPAIGPAGGMASALMNEQQRAEALAGWDQNPLTFMRHMSDWQKNDWAQKIQTGDVNPLFSELGPATTLGDQVMQVFGALNLPSNVAQRAWAGGPGDAVSRITSTPDEELTPEVVELKQQLADGLITKDRFLDEITMANAGYTNEFGTNLLLSMVADPLLLLSAGASKAGKLSIAGKMTKAENFVKKIEPGQWDELATAVERRATEAGTPVKEVTNQMIMEEAERIGIHGDALKAARAEMTSRERFQTDYAQWLEPVYKAAYAVADPFSSAIGMIGRRGSQPLKDAWLTAQATRGVADAYGMGNFRLLQGELQKLGKRDIFDTAMGHFTAQEGMFMQGELLAQDVASARRVSMARPTDVARARAGVGAQNYARQMETFVGRRKVDVSLPTGLGTGEAALTRARALAREKLVKMAGISDTEAGRIVDSLDADGVSLIDAAFYGHKIKNHTRVLRAARETAASKVAAGGRGSVRAQEAVSLLDRITLIGPRELTTGRAAALRDSLDSLPTAEAAKVGRDWIRKYDRLFQQFIADGPTDEEIVSGLRRSGSMTSATN